MITARKKFRCEQGVTLVELVIAIVIISIAFTALMSAYASIVSKSADPMVYQQAVVIADSMMEEIGSKAYPDAFSGACAAPPASRTDFDDVCDFNGYSSSTIVDVAGNDLGISGYSVLVEVSAAGGALGIPANAALKIDITIDNPLGNSVLLSSYRTQY